MTERRLICGGLLLLALLAWLFTVGGRAWGGQENSRITFAGTATSGQSAYRLDSSYLELGDNKYLAMGIRFKRRALAEDRYWALFGKNAGGNLSYGFTVSDTADNHRGRFWIDRTGDASSITLVYTNNNALESYGILSLVGEYRKVGVASSDLTIFVNGTQHNVELSGVEDCFNGTAPLAIGSAGPAFGYAPANVEVYGAWVAMADVPIVSSSNTILQWTNDPIAYPRAFAGAVSRFVEFGPTGTLAWVNGQFEDTGQVNASYISSTATAGASMWGANVTGSAFFIDSTALGTQFDTGKYGKLTLTDSTGRQAVGYLGARGTGVSTFGANLITNNPGGEGLVTAWTTLNATVTIPADPVTGVSSINVASSTVPGVASQVNFATTQNALYRGQAWVKNILGGHGAFYTLSSTYAGNASITDVAFTQKTHFRLSELAAISVYLYGSQGTYTAGDACRFDDVSLQRVLTPGSTGVSVYASPTGIGTEASSGWASVASGFNWNGIVSYTISGYAMQGQGFDMTVYGKPIAHLEELQPIRKTRSSPLRSRSGGWSAREFPIP